MMVALNNFMLSPYILRQLAPSLLSSHADKPESDNVKAR
ncbi:hypothetical protein VIS19158_08673 [Vibrio scophthalmi LMG 19158]|uniref:Uncharacterized protein n=1 Tax=Vibrio scophthalmi LMG 19158 TaxID=870967 RepID=F9RU73_9VIBR|nr:hypothetical protein VIS19158_08673 [Vibrio scophthalmi LMG 19158]